MNAYLKPLVDELLQLWKGTYLTAPGVLFPIRCALLCVSCDLPATQKVCGFTSFSSLQGCYKCMKKFTCEVFGTKSDYSGYEKGTWEVHTHDLHLQEVSVFENARTASDHQQNEKKYGVRYSELLRLPYFVIEKYHVIDPMHNHLLGTNKYLKTMWKNNGILAKRQFEYSYTTRCGCIKSPIECGRIPNKISSNFSGLTVDQWKNSVCIIFNTILEGTFTY